ncbi:MAG: hypothetical protein ACT4OG_04555 [Alphaproteobacteria bacterium]
MKTRSLAVSIIGAALMASAFAGPASALEMIVAEARGIGFKPGAVLDGTKALVLKEGQHVTLIAPNGATLELHGPYNRAPASDPDQGTSLQTKLAALVTQRQARLGEVGTTRGIAPAKLPAPWLLDATRTGNACLLDGQPPVFWRETAAAQAELTVMPSDRSWKAKVRWPAGKERLMVSLTDVPVHGGATYFVSLNGKDEIAMTVKSVPAVLTNDSMRAAWMAEKGCETQAEALLRTRK